MLKPILLGVFLALAIGTPTANAQKQLAAESAVTSTDKQKQPVELPPVPVLDEPAEPADKYQKKDQDEGSLLKSVGKVFGDAMGLLSADGRTEGEAGVPRRIAVLPAVGEGDEREREDIRTVIHNNLSSKNFDLLKPFDIDLRLAQLLQAEGRTHMDYDPTELADKLGVEGLIYVDVPLVEKIYAAAYAHYKITIKLSFYSKLDNNYIWEMEESIAEREGGISLNPLSFIAQAISSAQVLTEAVRQTLVDKLARQFAAKIPFPIGQRAKIKPIKIDLALSNVAEGPFRAGDEITVFMRAEPGLAATFDLGNKFTGNVLTEQGEGEYVGRYIVNNNDNADGLIIKVNATRIDNPASILWRVPGRVGIDTVVPQAIKEVVSSPVQDAIKLSWPAALSSKETLTYHIQRADPQSGLYDEVAAINISEYTDADIVEGNTYHYRIYAEDEANNQSPFANIEVAAVGIGPTDVTGDIISDTRFYAVASPYIINKPVRVLHNATLTLSPGAIIKFVGEGSLQVLGKVVGLGTEQSTISLSGESWALSFSNTGENQSRFSHTHFKQGSVIVDRSALQLQHCSLKNMSNAIEVRNQGKLDISEVEFSQNAVGLLVEDGELVVNQATFANNQIAWKATGQQLLTADNLSFEDNDVHITSSELMQVKNNFTFNDLDYEDFLDKIKGDVEVDWSMIADQNNLQQQWLKDRWEVIIDRASNELWQEAYEAVEALRLYAPEKGGQSERLASFHQALRFVTNKPTTGSDSFTLAIERFVKRQGKGRLWIQKAKLPYSKSTADSDAYIKKQASKKFVSSFLKQSYPSLKPAELRKYKRKVKISKDIVDSQVIYTSKKGLFLQVWVANYLDMEKINRSLTLAGLIQRQNSALTVGLLSQTDMFEFEELIVRALKKQRINTISLGTGSYGSPVQLKAKKMGANVVLETAVMVDETKSGISKNLKLADVHLILDLYDVQTNQTLNHLTASANKAGFKRREIVKKGVIEAYGTVESKLIAALWSADDIVAEHNKKEKARKKREQIAKAKARKARIAKEKAEKKRLAAEAQIKAQAEEKKKKKAKEEARLAALEKAKKQAEEAAQKPLAQAKAATTTSQVNGQVTKKITNKQPAEAIEPNKSSVTSAEITP